VLLLHSAVRPHQAITQLRPLCIGCWCCALPQGLCLLRCKLFLEACSKAAAVVL
jgi:hypothetical protein